MQVMDPEFTKRLFKPGSEPEMTHINNYCRLGIIDKLEFLFLNECKDVKNDFFICSDSIGSQQVELFSKNDSQHVGQPDR